MYGTTEPFDKWRCDSTREENKLLETVHQGTVHCTRALALESCTVRLYAARPGAERLIRYVNGKGFSSKFRSAGDVRLAGAKGCAQLLARAHVQWSQQSAEGHQLNFSLLLIFGRFPQGPSSAVDVRPIRKVKRWEVLAESQGQSEQKSVQYRPGMPVGRRFCLARGGTIMSWARRGKELRPRVVFYFSSPRRSGMPRAPPSPF